MFKMIKDVFTIRKLAKTMKEELAGMDLTNTDINALVNMIEDAVVATEVDYSMRKAFTNGIYAHIFRTLQDSLNGACGNDVKDHYTLEQPVYIKLLEAKTAEYVNSL